MTRRSRTRERRTGVETRRAVACLERKIPYFDLVGDEQLDLIEQHADRILAEVGIEIWGDDEAIRLFRDAGATVDGQRLRFDPGLVRSIVTATTPHQFIQHGRDPQRAVTIGGDHTVFAPGYGMPFVRDLDGGRRYGTIDDFDRLVKLNHTLEYTHHSGLVICEPTDVPVNKRHLDMVAAHLRYTTKPVLGAITAPSRAADSLDMARIVHGTDTLDDHLATVGEAAASIGLDVEHLQTNHEGELVDAVHAARGRCAAIIINPGAFTHYAWSVHDALAAFDGPVVEVHLSNPAAREPWRHTSGGAPVASGTVAGFGGDGGPAGGVEVVGGYRLAVAAVGRLLDR